MKVNHDYEFCKTCKEFHWTDKECAPIFYFKHDYWGDDFEEIRAYSFEDAARKFAVKYNEDSGDYPLMDGNTEDVVISDGKEEKSFTVGFEPDIYYTVTTKE